MKENKENRVKNYENIIRTTAEKRVDSYITDIGLPRNYGRYAPFKPFDCSHNLRYYNPPKSRIKKNN